MLCVAKGIWHDLSSSVVDPEGQMARFVAKALIVCGLVALTYWTWGHKAVVAVTGEVSFGNRNKD